MEESPQFTQPTPSNQPSTTPVNAPELHGQSPKKDYQRPKLELLGDVRIVTRY